MRNTTGVVLLLAGSLLPCAVFPHAAKAQQAGVVGQSEREIRILQERSAWAQEQIAKAKQALSDSDFRFLGPTADFRRQV